MKTSSKKFSFIAQVEHQNRRLDQVLAEKLPDLLRQPVSKSKIRKLIMAGAVYLNGKRVRIASKEIFYRAKIELYVDLDRLQADATTQDQVFEMSDDRVLFEDEFLIVVNKPPGLPTQATLDQARDHLYAAVKRYLGRREKNPYLGLHHRLDRDTSGVVLLTKSTAANAGVAALFANRLAKKSYQALAWAEPKGSPQDWPKSWEVQNYLARAASSGKKAKMVSVRSGGDIARTEFRLLGQFGPGVWVEAQPQTGRMHQIRVHLAEGGLPILGDCTYGGRSEILSPGLGPSQVPSRVPRMMLHAARLTFQHPIHQNEISVESPLPEDFRGCLELLQKGWPDS